MQKVKFAAEAVLSVLKISEEAAVGRYSLSVLFKNRAAQVDGSLDATMVHVGVHRCLGESMSAIERPSPSLLSALASNWSYGGAVICFLGALYMNNPSANPIGLIVILAGLMMVLLGYIRTRQLCIHGVEVEAKCTRSRGYKGIPILTLSYKFEGIPYTTSLEVDVFRSLRGRLHLGGTGMVTLLIDPNSPQRVLIKLWFYPSTKDAK